MICLPKKPWYKAISFKHLEQPGLTDLKSVSGASVFSLLKKDIQLASQGSKFQIWLLNWTLDLYVNFGARTHNSPDQLNRFKSNILPLCNHATINWVVCVQVSYIRIRWLDRYSHKQCTHSRSPSQQFEATNKCHSLFKTQATTNNPQRDRSFDHCFIKSGPDARCFQHELVLWKKGSGLIPHIESRISI